MKLRRLWLDNVGPFHGLDIEIPAGTRPDLADVVIVTGPNGSGKTTLLRAIATVLAASDQLGTRLNPDGEVVAEVDANGISNVVAYIGETRDYDTDHAPWRSALDRHLIRRGREPFMGWPGDVVALEPIFAYGPFRRIDKVGPLTIGDNTADLSTGASDFETPLASQAFISWVANTRTKLALAREDGDGSAVERYQRAIQMIETSITELIGETFSLFVNREPLEVRALVNGVSTPLDTLPDGLRSSLAWLGDVLRRLDGIKIDPGTDPLSLPIQILLDEVDVHLHPDWQRRILVVAERLLPNAQIIVSTHSPFVVQSAPDACIIKLSEHGVTAEVLASQYASSVDAVLDDVLNVSDADFGIEITRELDDLRAVRNSVLKGSTPFEVFEAKAITLASKSLSLDLRLRPHVEEVRRRLGVA